MSFSAGLGPHAIPTNHNEKKYSGLSQGDATAVIIDLDKYNDMVKEDSINFKIVNCGKIPHNTKNIRQLFKRIKKIDDFTAVSKDIILGQGDLSDLFFLKTQDFANEQGVSKGDLPVGVGPGGDWLTQYKAASTNFQTLLIGFEVVDDKIVIGGGVKMVDLLHGNSIFYDYTQKSIIDQFQKNFNTRFTYYVIVYKPEKTGLF